MIPWAISEIWLRTDKNCWKWPFFDSFLLARRPSWKFSSFQKDVHLSRMMAEVILEFQNDPMSHLWDLTPDGKTETGKTEGIPISPFCVVRCEARKYCQFVRRRPVRCWYYWHLSCLQHFSWGQGVFRPVMKCIPSPRWASQETVSWPKTDVVAIAQMKIVKTLHLLVPCKRVNVTVLCQMIWHDMRCYCK